MKNSNNSNKMFGALMIGTMVGAAAGILFAPRKGSKTRQNIAKGTQNLANSAKNLTNDLKHKASSSFNDLKHKANTNYDDLANMSKRTANNVDGQASNFAKDYTQKI